MSNIDTQDNASIVDDIISITDDTTSSLLKRGQPTFTYHVSKETVEVGVDEAGRGPLFGPVYAGAVVWDPEIKSSLICDSKKLNHRQHLIAYDFIRENCIAWGVASVDHEEIDKINILNASLKAMHLAIDDCGIIPQHILVDGNKFKLYSDRDDNTISYSTIVEGDSKYYSIAAAGIVAKISRDTFIEKLCDEHPELDIYNIRSNKGYGCKKHMDGIANWGISEWHRKSFKTCKQSN